MASAYAVEQELRYPGRRKGSDFATSDVLVSEDEVLAIAIECKATKLTIAAQFLDDPRVDAESRLSEIGKAVLQLWRLFAHCRLGMTGRRLDKRTEGVVLTLDNWLVMGPVLGEHVMNVAHALADADLDVTSADRRLVVFSTIQDFEQLLASSDEATIRATIAASHQGQLQGWRWPNIGRHINGSPQLRKPYPFRPAELLPWWRRSRSEAEDASYDSDVDGA